MTGMIRLLGVLALVGASATSATGQAGATSWKELLEARTRVAYRYTHPAPTGECGPVDLPATARLLPSRDGNPIGRTWQAGPNHSRWEPISGPNVSAPLDVRVVGLWCGPTGESLLVETDGYYLEVYTARLATVDELGTMTPGILLAPVDDGEYVQVLLREECVAANCRFTLADAGAIAEEVRFAVAQREEAERARRAEAAARVEQQAQARLNAGAAVRAQAGAVAAQQQAETLQRLGATQEQANAIMQRRVLVGMTAAMVRAALGEPARIVADPSARQKTETWSYTGRQILLVADRVTEIR